jgi:ribosomal protein S18 acetylase RimI-like enzyme
MSTIRLATETDYEQVWKIIRTVIHAGDSYVFHPDSSREKMLDNWFHADKRTYVYEEQGQILGTFFLKPNQLDLGAHIANAGYMVSPEARGKGIGKAMGEFSIGEAARLGFQAMQFNIVVKTNTVAVQLWQSLGFQIIGEIPEAYQHARHGLTNAYIMYRKV